jgi:1-acyl-sn-glycerol-3-phosphate acyltransferase
MRADLARNPVFGGLARLAGFVPNDRGHMLVRGGLERIRRGENLLIFPEGTRTRNRTVNAFKKGFALIATSANAPIQTVFIEREGRYLSKQFPLFAPVALPVRFRVRLGDVIHPRPGERAPELAVRVERYFQERLAIVDGEIRIAPKPAPAEVQYHMP